MRETLLVPGHALKAVDLEPKHSAIWRFFAHFSLDPAGGGLSWRRAAENLRKACKDKGAPAVFGRLRVVKEAVAAAWQKGPDMGFPGGSTMVSRHVFVIAGIVCLIACGGAGGARQALAGTGGTDAAATSQMLERAKALRLVGKNDAALDVLLKARERALKAGDKALLYKIDIRIGGLDLSRGHSSEALVAFDRARGTAQELAKTARRPAPWLHEVFSCYQRIGDIDMNLRGVEQATAAYQAGVNVARRMVALEPDEAEWKMDLARALGKAASAGAGPVSYLEEALAILKDVEAKGQLTPARRFWAERIGKALEMVRRKQGKGAKAGKPAK